MQRISNVLGVGLSGQRTGGLFGYGCVHFSSLFSSAAIFRLILFAQYVTMIFR